jgi:hypothetical protein
MYNKYVCTGPANILLERTPRKKLADLHPTEKIIYFEGTIFQSSTKPLFTSQNRVEIREKNSPFLKNMLLLPQLLHRVSMKQPTHVDF